MNRALIVFAREPIPGKVKTRLGRDLGNQAAAELYCAMLADVLEQATALADVRPLLFWSLEGSRTPALPDLPKLESHRQRGEDLGQRMANAFEQAFGLGCQACCIIGTDSPDLPPDYIRQAFDLLGQDRADAVFGPAEDGGYYLLGLNRPCPGLFEDVAWGTPQVLARSLGRAREMGLRTSLLAPWYDIDTQHDLFRLLDSPGQAAPRTRATARGLMKQGQTVPPCPDTPFQERRP